MPGSACKTRWISWRPDVRCHHVLALRTWLQWSKRYNKNIVLCLVTMSLFEANPTIYLDWKVKYRMISDQKYYNNEINAVMPTGDRIPIHSL